MGAPSAISQSGSSVNPRPPRSEFGVIVLAHITIVQLDGKIILSVPSGEAGIFDQREFEDLVERFFWEKF